MARWHVGISALGVAGRVATDDAAETARETDQEDAGVSCVFVSVVSSDAKSIAWHLLTTTETTETEDALTHVRVVLETLRWQEDAPHAAEIVVFFVSDSAPQWRERVEALALAQGYQVAASEHGPTSDRELKDESVQMLLSPAAGAVYRDIRSAIDVAVFESCVDVTFLLAVEYGTILGNPRVEHGFQLTVETHSIPLRPYLRLDDAAQKMWIKPSTRPSSPSIIGLLRPLCRTKMGRTTLLQRLHKPEVDIAILHERHDHLNTLTLSLTDASTVGVALMQLFDCIGHADAKHAWFSGSRRGRGSSSIPPPTLQEFRTFCQFVRGLESKCEALQKAFEACGARSLNDAYVNRLVSTLSAATAHFVPSAESQLEAILSGESADVNLVSTITTLRRQTTECEKAIRAHHEEIATHLLLPRERIRVVFEDDDSTNSRSTTPSVVFRVTRQDGHRVFKANAEKDTGPLHRRVTLVFSRRTTGVWFSTRQLDTLAAQRRALQVDINRLEGQLVSSLVHEYDLHARGHLDECVRIVADLDVLSAFSQVSAGHGFSRAIVTDEEQALEIEGLRWPWDEPSLSRDSRVSSKRARLNSADPRSVQLVCLSEDKRTLVIHSAVEDDATVLGRLALAIVLNQAGCFVPCTQGKLPVFDSLFVRSGAVDNTLANRSTFLTEMQQMSRILDRATPRSLVLIDEICRGTSPGEGLPLAIAICEYLAENRVATILTTQWTELFDALVAKDFTTVPSNSADATSSVEAMKRVYSERLTECNSRFIARLNELEFPREIVEDLALDLSTPRDTQQ